MFKVYEEKEYKENPHYYKDILKPIIDQHIERRDYLDTKSNATLSPLKRKREEMLSQE